AWDSIDRRKAINYWWGMDSGVLDVSLSPSLPGGVSTLGRILKNGLTDGTVDPFQTRIIDRDGVLRSDGTNIFTAEELLLMDWFCENVDAVIPVFDDLIPVSRATVRMLGLYRDELSPEKEEAQL
ncbi:MAG: hypothetical protein IKD79_02380, partial [Oscillospiraceae bacterium]|nr:hypothetical protein [Oscillospiraceae bacterium]